jgi:hypothetical protein
MTHKNSLILLSLFFLSNLPIALGEKRNVLVTESSTSGKLIRVTLGSNAGVIQGEPVLFSDGSEKIAAGRVIRVAPTFSIVAVLEKYVDEGPTPESDYEMLYGEPFDEAENLPDYVADRESELDNPANETFMERRGIEESPDLDDDDYTPEIALRPELPVPQTYGRHNLTLGIKFFRDRALPSTSNPDLNTNSNTDFSVYQGYAFRYAYSFKTHYWLKMRTPALISAEFMMGVYNFEHTFPDNRIAQIRVIPVGFNLRYMLEVNKMIRLYPYVGYQQNIVSTFEGGPSSTSATNNNASAIKGGRIIGGAGAQLVMSESMDGRIEGGSDGVLAGLVVKF